jgi:predicted RND superfamily exporter protein
VADHPVAAVVLTFVLTLVLAAQMPRLRIDESAEGLMVERDPARAFYEQARQRFGSDNLTVVLVKADDVFTPAVLTAVRRLSDGLERVAGVSRVESLTTTKNIKGEGDALTTDPLVGAAIPTAPAELARLRADALGSRVLVGNLVAADGRATALVVYADARPGETEFNRRFTMDVDALVARETRPGLTIYQVGAPMTKATYAQYLKADQRTIIPLSTVVLIVTLFLAVRTLQGVVIPVVTAVVSIVWSLGLMAVTGIPLTILTAIIPSLMLAIGFTEDVHMISEYHHRLEHGDDKLTALRTMLGESAMPILVTTATTVLGFGSLITTDITMLIQFGYASAMALTANYVVTMLLLPPMLRWWPVPRRLRRGALADGSSHGGIPRLMQRLGEFNLRWRVPILVAWGALTLGSLAGWLGLRVNTDLISFFPERSAIRQRVADLSRSLSGGLAFYVVVDTGHDDGIKNPAVLRRIAGLQDHLAATGRVDKTISVADYVRKMHREMHGGDPAFETIPETSDQVAQYLLMLEGRELEKFVDFKAAAANIVVRHHLTGSGDLSALLRDIERHVARDVPPTVIVRATGEEVLFNNASDYMAINELTSFSSTFVIIGAIHALLFMSLRAGILSLIPNVVPILLLYGFMGLVGIPLNTSTAMIATGIAVDDTVHHMVTYSRQLNEHHDQRRAMFETLRIEGRPIIYVSIALAAGFLTLVASNFVATVYFGVLAAFVMLVAMVAELTLTPILMVSTPLLTVWDMVMLRMSGDVRRAPLFAGLSRWEARKVVLLGGLHEYEAGAPVIVKGEIGTEMYMVVTGRVRVFDPLPDGGGRTLTVLGPGGIIGEIGVLTQQVRSASVLAEARSELLRLDHAALERVRKWSPYTSAKLFRNIARMLGERLREATQPGVESALSPRV